MNEHPNTDPSDKKLVSLAQAGDRAAFDTLCDRYLPVVYNRLRAKLPPDAVEDVTQDVFVAATRGIKRFRRNASFHTWICAIARHKVADFYRRRERNPETVLLDAAVHGEGVNEEADGAAARDDWEERRLVRIVLRRLPDHYQEVLLLRFAEGLMFKNVAKELGISLEATKSRYRRAVAALSEEMKRGG